MNIKSILGIEKTLYIPELISVNELGIGSSVNADKALSIASFWRGVNIIANTVASLPFRVYQNKEQQKQHEAFYLLKHKSNNFQSSFEFINTMIMLMLVKGNSFALIERNEIGKQIGYQIINYNVVEAILLDEKLYFRFDSEKDKTFLNDDLIHFKGIGSGFLGIDPIKNFVKNLEISINATSYTNKVYTGEASSLKGTITYDKALNKEQRERLRGELQTNFSGQNGKRILFLEDGMKLDNIALSPEQTSFLQSRKFEIEEIANMLNLPAFMLSAEKNTGTGVEADNIRFYQTSLLPLITKIEKELEIKLLTKNEILDDYYIKASVNSILRGDSVSRGNFYKSLFYLGAISPEEIRDLEDMPTEVKGQNFIQANLIPANMVGRFWDSKNRDQYGAALLKEQQLNEDEDE